MNDWIPIFKTGTHTDSNGDTKTWTEEDLDKIATYNPQEHEAPIVIGHPKDNSPAWGWVEGIKREDNILYAKLKNLVPEFVDMVKNGMFKKRSISLYPDGTLRHLGFLGAMPPAVKGLANIKFAKGGNFMSLEFESFAATEEEKNAQQKRSKKYGIAIREDGNVTKPSEWDDVPDDEWLDPVNYAYPCPDADQTRAAAVYWGRERNKNKYSQSDQEVMNEKLEKFRKKFKIGEYARKEETNMSFWERLKKRLADVGVSFVEIFGSETPPTLYTDADIKTKIDEAIAEAMKAKEIEFAEAKENIKKREELLSKKEKDAKKSAINSFCEDLKKKGILIPAMEKLGMGITEFMSQISTIETEIEFDEGDEKRKQTPIEFMQAFLLNLPKAIEFGEIAGSDKDISRNNNEKREKLVSEFMEKNPKVTYKEAVLTVLKKYPELREEG